MMARRNFIRILGGGVIVAAGAAVVVPGLDAMPASAIEGWAGPRAQERDPRRRAIAWAMLAPNPHNMQSWLVDLKRPDEIVLYVDRGRLLPETDPFGRQIAVGQGAFLELLSLALAAEGHRADITLFPEGEFAMDRIDGRPVAHIRLVKDGAIKADPLFVQIPRRRSTKKPYEARLLMEAHRQALTASHTAASALPLGFAVGDAHAGDLRTIATKASEIEMNTPRTHKESIDRLRIGAAEIAAHRDGLVMAGPAVWFGRQLGLITPDKAMTPGTTAWQSGRDYVLAPYANAMSFGWISAPGNTRSAQVLAGRAYARLNLKAAELGVAMQPHSQALQEYPEMADLYRAIHKATATPDGLTVQMFFRLGYADAPGPAPRRPPDSIVMG